MHKKYLYGALLFATCFGAFILTGLRDKEDAKLDRYFVDFDVSMKKNNHPEKSVQSADCHFYELFKKVYEKNHPAQILQNKQKITKIPKIIHQIWLGSPFPEKYRAFQQSWKQHHTDWEYRLWTEKELADFPMRHRDLFDASMNYGEKSDIARYEILQQMGGLYVDTDFECLQPFDILHHAYDFFIGIQPLDTSCVQLGIGLIGTVPHHPLLKLCLDNLKANCMQQQQIVARTGPIYFTRVFGSLAPLLSSATVALPASFFYPRGYYQTAEEKATWLCPESFAVHHWEGSWLKKEAFVPQEARSGADL
jgi:mannosyltransferase OCH1-like enzyme